MAKTVKKEESPEKKEKDQMWLFFQVKMSFTGRLCGSVPLKKELIEPWLRARMPEQKPNAARPIEEIQAEVEATIGEVEERITLGFQRDAVGLFVRADTIRAHLKDCANQLRQFMEVSGFKSKVSNRVYVEATGGIAPPKGSDYKPLYLLRDEKVLQNEDEEFERPVHAMSAQGFPVNALKRVKFVRRPTIWFLVKILNDGVIKEKHLQKILEYGSVHGFGGERSMQEGQYEFSISGLK